MIVASGIENNRPYTDLEVSIEAIQLILQYKNVSGKLLYARKGTILIRIFTARDVNHKEAVETLLQAIEENHV